MKKYSKFKRVYVWQLPVRIFHWLNVLALVVLVVTGFIIADPPALLSHVEATDLHSFGVIRFLHFSAGYVFFIVLLLRVYWSFVGNKFSHWTAFWPFSKKNWSNVKHVIKTDLLLVNEKKYDVRNISIGHNSVATFSYVFMFIFALVQIFTGFALMEDMSSWWLPKMFAWVTPFLGSDFTVRNIHHITMWLFIFFVVVHVYLVLYHDWLEGRGEVSSMVGGYKFVVEERIKAEEEDKENKTAK